MGIGELEGEPEEALSLELVVSFVMQRLTHACSREKREHRVFLALLMIVPGLQERLTEESNEGIMHIADLVCTVPGNQLID
jgi:hypothetical protein